MFDFVVGLGQGGGRLAKTFHEGMGVPLVVMNLAHFLLLLLSQKASFETSVNVTSRTENLTRHRTFQIAV